MADGSISGTSSRELSDGEIRPMSRFYECPLLGVQQTWPYCSANVRYWPKADISPSCRFGISPLAVGPTQFSVVVWYTPRRAILPWMLDFAGGGWLLRLRFWRH
jgi:hypothetical protein